MSTDTRLKRVIPKGTAPEDPAVMRSRLSKNMMPKTILQTFIRHNRHNIDNSNDIRRKENRCHEGLLASIGPTHRCIGST